ncbi:MAG: CDP-alcohol phosphatidyltransferase family protein [Proteobacteria bacterium]|nr:CDP-alcohol phosphatidyltransferase family protein [Pseudomonadota bacterium]
MKTFVNSLTAFRIIAAFALIPCLAYQWFWVMFALFTIAGITDFFDGILAHKYHVETKLGGVMDHIADKLLVTISSVLLAMFLQYWMVFIPVILMICRELYVSGLREFLGTQRIEMPVPATGYFAWGRVKAFAQMMSIGALFLLIALLPYASTSKTMYYILYYFQIAGILGLWIALLASAISAWQYTRDFLARVKKIKK